MPRFAPRTRLSLSFMALLFLAPDTERITAQDKSGQVLFYRMLGSDRGSPFPVRTRTICKIEGSNITNTTGMARSGYTEYPFRKGRISYTFAENYCYYPRIASGASVDPSRIGTGDILIDALYEPDPVVWGATGREFVQTFVAEGPELVSLTLLIATEPGLFHARLLEGGPGGKPIGPLAYFRSGHSITWGWARWRAGEAPTVEGKSYGIRVARADGAPFRPYLHASGDVYANGELYVDGRRQPGSELGAWIVEESSDLRRALILDADADGWVYDTQTVEFRPRSRNVRLVNVTLSPAVEKCRDILLWIRDPQSGEILAGPEVCANCTKPGTVRRVQFLFAENRMLVDPGKVYALEVGGIPHRGEVPERSEDQAFDLRAWVYGEPEGKALPAIHDLRWSFENKADIRFDWSMTQPARVTLELSRLSPGETRIFPVAADRSELFVPHLWRGHDYEVSLVATASDGRTWRTPTYRFRPPGGPHPPPPPYLYPEHPEVMPQVAPPPTNRVATRAIIRARGVIPLKNASFEDGLEGWHTSSELDPIGAHTETDHASPPHGSTMAGWAVEAGERREQVFARGYLWQDVTTTPGRVYLLSVRCMTSAVGGPRGDTRIRLCADTNGRGEFGDSDGTQWYWTDGRWVRHELTFRATGAKTSIGVGFFRWRDIDRADAYVDMFRLYDLGASPVGAFARASAHQSEHVPHQILESPRFEASDRVEAWLSIPPGYAMTGLGFRAAGDNVTTIRARMQPLLHDGRLGPPEYLFGGLEPDAGLEASIDLPATYVSTGFGARIAPEWDVKTFALWGRPLEGTGGLGAEKEFRAGVEPQGGLERQVRLEKGRVLIGAGLRCHLNDAAGIRASSARLAPSATRRQAARRP